LRINKLVVRWTDRLLVASFVLALAAYGYIGFFSRYMADDYTYWINVHVRGLLGGQIHLYMGWTGRFSFILAVNLCSLLGSHFVRFLPALLLATWLAALAWAINSSGFADTPKPSYVKSLLLAGLVVLATLVIAPNVVQSLFWQSGSLTYVAPLIFLSFYAGIISSGLRALRERATRPSALSLCGSALLLLIAGGFSESYVVLQTAGLLLALVACWRYAPDKLKPALRSLLVAGLIGSLLALIVVVLAPGNSIRRAYFPPPPGLFQLIKLSSIYSFRFITGSIFNHRLVLSVSVLVPFLLTLRDAPGSRTQTDEERHAHAEALVLLPVAIFSLIVCSIVPSFYGMSVMLPDRSQVLLSFTLVCGAVAWGHSAGKFCRIALPVAGPDGSSVVPLCLSLMLILLSAFPIASCVSTFGLRGRAIDYAADWDRQDEEIRAAKNGGARELTVEQIGDFQSRLGIGDSDLHLRTQPNFWINKVVAKYYGIDSVAARQDPSNLPRR
jgi:hypothetical protein